MPGTLDPEGVAHGLTFPPRKARQAQRHTPQYSHHNMSPPSAGGNDGEGAATQLQLPPLPAAQRVLISDATTTPTASQLPSETAPGTSRPRKGHANNHNNHNNTRNNISPIGNINSDNKSMSATTMASALSLTEHAMTIATGSRRTSQPALQPPLFQSVMHAANTSSTTMNNTSYSNAQAVVTRTPGRLTPLRASHSCVSSMSTRSTAHPHARHTRNGSNNNNNNATMSSNMLLSSDSVRSSLLRSHRLANPADAFKLRSSVVEAAVPVRASSSVPSRYFLHDASAHGSGGEEDVVRMEVAGLDFRTPHRLGHGSTMDGPAGSFHGAQHSTNHTGSSVGEKTLQQQHLQGGAQTSIGSGRPPFYPRNNNNNHTSATTISNTVSGSNDGGGAKGDLRYVYTHNLAASAAPGSTGDGAQRTMMTMMNGQGDAAYGTQAIQQQQTAGEKNALLLAGQEGALLRSPQSAATIRTSTSHTNTSWNSPAASDIAAQQKDGNSNGGGSGGAGRKETTAQKTERLQRELASSYGRWHHRRQKAACVVQRAWRCYCARRALFVRQQILYRAMYVRQKAAGRCIAGFLRGCLVRGRRHALAEQRAQHDALRAALERRVLHSVQVITRCAQAWLKQRYARAALCRLLKLQAAHQLRRYEVAAVLVQRWWRLVLPQKQYWRRRHAERAAQAALAAEEARRAHAATTIQKLVRGRQTRKAIVVLRGKLIRERHERQARLRQATTVISVALREYAARVQRLQACEVAHAAKVRDSVRTIEEGWRAALARRGVAQALGQVRRWIAAACTLQRAWRRWYAQRELRYLRQLRSTALDDRLQSERREYVARLRLQCFARVVLAKAAVRRHRAHYGREVFEAMHLLQAVGRGCRTRRALHDDYVVQQAEKARTIAAQAALRAHHECVLAAFTQARQSALHCARRAIVEQRERLLVRIGVREEMAREAGARRIQRCYRRYRQRCAHAMAALQLFYAKAQVCAAVVQVQTWWRARKACEEYRGRCAARDAAVVARMEAEEVMLAIADEPQLQWWQTRHDADGGERREKEMQTAERWAALYVET